MRMLALSAGLLCSLVTAGAGRAPSTLIFEDDFEAGLGVWSKSVPALVDPATVWRADLEPALLLNCGSCHLGDRFAISTMRRAGAAPTAAESAHNRAVFQRLISLDDPKSSRLLAKVLPGSDSRQIDHGGGPLLEDGDALYQRILGWIVSEKNAACPDCGTTAATTYVAYVDEPSVHWAIPREVDRPDWGIRSGARIKMQPMDAATMTTSGTPFDFLPPSFCASDECDYGYLAASHAGDRLAFECRKQIGDEPLEEQSWNICIAEIGGDGRAVNPRFLLPANRRHSGWTNSRTSPFGLYKPNGEPLRGNYDLFHMLRRLNDQHPAFSPDDEYVYFSTRGPDPITGVHAARTYHGFEHINHIVGYREGDGSWTRPYINEGGVADFPVFLQNGNLGIHTWNLERTDRHMIHQVGVDGDGTLPVLFGRLQGPNQWGAYTQLNNGELFGITGRRRGQIERYVAYVADHTLGTGSNINPSLASFTVLDPALHAQMVEFGFCNAPPSGPNCKIDRFYADPAWAPDGRALVAYTSSGVYSHRGHEMFADYSVGDTTQERLASLAPYLPSGLGIALMSHRGSVSTLIAPAGGRALRHPVWVGKRHPTTPAAQRVQHTEATENGAAIMHIADVPVWFSFDTQDSGFSDSFKSGLIDDLDQMTALRILVKDLEGNACTSDSFAYRHAVADDKHDHPTHLGIYNSTGYRQLIAESGATNFGDVALEADHSVKLHLPTGKLLLFQGVDSSGHVVAQKSRLFSLPEREPDDPEEIFPGVKRSQYRAQCGTCHGAIEDPEAFRDLTEVDLLPAGALDRATDAGGKAAIELAASDQPTRLLTYRQSLRSVLDARCVSCHSGASPAAELSLASEYSATANYPAGKWATDPDLANSDYLDYVPAAKRVPGYDWSVSYHWLLQRADGEYQQAPEYASLRSGHAPIADLAPWDPGYQALHAKASNGYALYLAHDVEPGHMGRSDNHGGNSSSSYLLEVLTGDDLVDGKTYSGSFDHTSVLTAHETALLKAVIDVGFPYMERCDDLVVPSGPNQGSFWGDPTPDP